MIRQSQSITADKRTRTAIVEPDTGKANVVEPFLRWCKSILFLQYLERQIVECPHPLVWPGMESREQQNTGDTKNQ
jgi:hypothetical protein